MTDCSKLHTLENSRNINIFKNRVKTHLLELQGTGIENEWQSTNFLLTYYMKGIRASKRLGSHNNNSDDH